MIISVIDNITSEYLVILQQGKFSLIIYYKTCVVIRVTRVPAMSYEEINEKYGIKLVRTRLWC